MIVGIVDHNNVEEISYKITLKGIKSEYDEKRQNIVKINAEENRKLWCNKKIWYRSLFDDIPKNFDEQMPLLTFKIQLQH
uniref:Uncharacterized protein n=1 Tax=Panagrolaimus superbus TaxID=310955 RepID=A0A914XVH3_9BILA